MQTSVKKVNGESTSQGTTSQNNAGQCQTTVQIQPAPATAYSMQQMPPMQPMPSMQPMQQPPHMQQQMQQQMQQMQHMPMQPMYTQQQMAPMFQYNPRLSQRKGGSGCSIGCIIIFLVFSLVTIGLGQTYSSVHHLTSDKGIVKVITNVWYGAEGFRIVVGVYIYLYCCT